MTFDNVNKPSHYTEGRRFETIEVIEDWELSYRLGNALKYVSRAGRKDPAKTVEDLKKARWYLTREIEALEGAQSPYGVTYEDVLEDQAAAAAEGERLVTEYGVEEDQIEFSSTTPDCSIRVYDLAEELHVAYRRVLEVCGVLGIGAKDRLTVLSGDAADRIREVFKYGEAWQSAESAQTDAITAPDRFIQVRDLADELCLSPARVLEVCRVLRIYVEDRFTLLSGASADRVRQSLLLTQGLISGPPTVGPVELTEEEIREAVANKDLEQFEEDEIVRTFERRGLIFGVKRDGSTCILNDGGQCAQ